MSNNINTLLQSGTILENKYKIVNLVKKGGMGAVYKAYDIKFVNNFYAIKELLPIYGTPLEQEQSRKWFEREAKILKNLTHANLPKIFDYFICNERYYLVMDLIEGDDLDTILQKEGKPGLPVEKVMEWSIQVLDVLIYLHNQNPTIIYRDLKPANIMLNKNEKIILIDFGIARVIHQNSQTTKTIIGTEGYSPPEQYRGKSEIRSDIYSLGATMHHLLTGISPIPFKFDPLRTINPNIPYHIENIVMKALKDNLTDRFSSAKEMADTIKKQNLLNKQQENLSFNKITDNSLSKEDQILYYIAEAKACSKNKQYDETIKLCEKVLKLEPGNTEAYVEKKYAIEEKVGYEKKNPAKPFNTEIYNSLSKEDQILYYIAEAKACSKNKQYDETIKLCEKVLKLEPGNTEAYVEKKYAIE
ncbi:MAG: protein kinase, partial [Elusimicrobiota bacterium]